MYITFEGCLSETSQHRIDVLDLGLGDKLIDNLKVRDVLFKTSPDLASWIHSSAKYLQIDVVVVADIPSEVPAAASILFDTISGPDFLALSNHRTDDVASKEDTPHDPTEDE